MRSTSYLAYFIIAIALLWHVTSCSNQVTLGGGPKDELAPRLDSLLSFRNEQLNYQKSDIDLFFDEYINLQDVVKQVVISPPLRFPPNIEARLKRLRLTFDDQESLKEDATYVVNFGEAISDYTEGNKLKNFTIVFSTGNFIDSLSLQGHVKDAYSLKPSEDVLVMLYESFEDSIVFKERPFYFAKTDKDGKFEINNIRHDTFKLVVLKDLNLNYLYEPQSEEIGFLSKLLEMNDTVRHELDLRTFKGSQGAQYKSYEVMAQGQMRIEFDKTPEPNSIELQGELKHYLEINEGDPNALLYYAPRDLNQLQFLVAKTESIKDTINPRINLRSLDTIRTSLSIISISGENKPGLHPDQTLVIRLSKPIISQDLSKIIAIDTSHMDSIYLEPVAQQMPNHILQYKGAWKAGSDINLQFLPGAFIDFFEKSNDTIVRNLKIGNLEDFGSIELSFMNLDSSMNYFIELLKAEKVIASKSINFASPSWTIDRLSAGIYDLRITLDANNNGQWDTGNYLQNLQAEEIYSTKLDDLRAGWNLKPKIDIKELIEKVDQDSEVKDENNPAQSKKPIQNRK